MRNRQVYEKRHLDNWRAYSCVAFSPLFSRLYLPTGGQSGPVYSMRSARIFAQGFLKAAFRSKPLPLLLHFGVIYLWLDLRLDRTIPA